MVCQGLHVLDPDVWLVRGTTERMVATIDEGAAHADHLCPQAIEGTVGYEQDFVHLHTHDFSRFGIRSHIRFETSWLPVQPLHSLLRGFCQQTRVVSWIRQEVAKRSPL